MKSSINHAIRPLTPEIEERIGRNPLLNMDTFIIPSPYIKDAKIELDYHHSYIWQEEGEVLGYIVVYSDAENSSFHIYKLVTSPFGRGRGIGTAFIEYLAANVPLTATVYLYLWERQADTLEFFRGKGFTLGDTIVYRNLIYYHLSARPSEIMERATALLDDSQRRNDDIGKARHDARKTIRFLSHMVDSLSMENSNRIIEDINRESTTLINILNVFRDTTQRMHEVNLRDLLLERIVPFIESSSVPCRINVTIDTKSPKVLGYYVNYGRALVNIVSNALDAIRESGRKGIITIKLFDDQEQLALTIEDNGVGISSDRLVRDEHGVPAFVGMTTKERDKGEGLGSVQIFSTFDPGQITIQSRKGFGTTWTLHFDRPPRGAGEKWYAQLDRRFHEFQSLIEIGEISAATPRTEVIAYIWQIRKMEMFLYDLIMQFGRDHNIRSIYRNVFACTMEKMSEEAFGEEVAGYSCDHPRMKHWLCEMTFMVRRRMQHLRETVDLEKYRAAMFRSYGQAIDHVMIFTIDPETGNFFSTDRKLAEHLDFAPYLGKERDNLIRGEFVGDLNAHDQPISLGVWSIVSDEDLMRKLQLIREAAQRLIEKGVHKEKRLSLYQTTYVRYTHDINADMATTFGEMVRLTNDELRRFIRVADDELDGYFMMQE